MKHMLATFAAVTLAGGIAAASINTRSLYPSQDELIASMSEKSGEKLNVDLIRVERNGTIYAHMIAQGGEANITHVFTEDEAMDLTSLIIQNGFFSSGNSQRAGLTIWIGGVQPMFFTMDGYSTDQYTFPTPLALRAGDAIVVTTPSAMVSTQFTQIQLIGTPLQPEGIELR